VEPARADRARVEHRQAAIAADERQVRMAADHQRRLARPRPLAHVGAQLGAIQRDVRQQQPKLAIGPHQIEHQHVGQLRGAHVDVAAHGKQRRELGQPIQHRQVADVPRVKDRIWRQRREVIGDRRVRSRVRVGDHGDARVAVLAKRQRRRLLDHRGPHCPSVSRSCSRTRVSGTKRSTPQRGQQGPPRAAAARAV